MFFFFFKFCILLKLYLLIFTDLLHLYFLHVQKVLLVQDFAVHISIVLRHSLFDVLKSCLAFWYGPGKKLLMVALLYHVYLLLKLFSVGNVSLLVPYIILSYHVHSMFSCVVASHKLILWFLSVQVAF